MKNFWPTLDQNFLRSKKVSPPLTILKITKLFLLTSLLISCSGAKKELPTNLIPVSKFSTKIKITMKDKKPVSVSVDIIIAKKEKKIRIETSTILGINVASIALNNSHLSYYLHRTKEYYNGKATELKISFNKHTSFPLTFSQFKFILNQKIPINKNMPGWNCIEETKSLTSCRTKEVDVIFQEKKKKLFIDIIDKVQEFKLSLYVKKAKHNEMVKENIFIIPKP